MARHITQEVTDLVEEPEEGPHQLVLVVEEDELDTAEARAEEYDVAVRSRVEPSVLVVDIDGYLIEEFCRPSYIRSVSFDKGMEVMGSGNLSPPLE